MGYRRPHHRRAHTRTNADGSKSYVRESDVKGHNYEKEKGHSYSSSGDGLGELFATVAFAGFILFILGLLLRWDDTLWFLGVFAVSLLLMYIRNKCSR